MDTKANTQSKKIWNGQTRRNSEETKPIEIAGSCT